MFAHSYSKLSRTCCGESTHMPCKKVQFWDGCRNMMMTMMKRNRECLRHAATSYLTDLYIPVSAMTARCCLYIRLHAVTWWSYALDCHVMDHTTQLHCLWSCSLELSTSSRSRHLHHHPVSAAISKLNFFAGHMELIRCRMVQLQNGYYIVCAEYPRTENYGQKLRGQQWTPKGIEPMDY